MKEKLSLQTHPAAHHPERIIQFGEGNFLRAFMDWIVETLNEQADFDSSVVVVQPIEQGLVDMLNSQDGLYTLYLNESRNGERYSEHQVISSISRGINPYTDYEDYLTLAHNPELTFVFSNTTEAGIAFNDTDRLEDRPAKNFPGKLTALLYERYRHFSGAADKGLIFLPCELIDRNGDKLKQCILQYAALWQLEAGFTQWICEHNTFCCSLVDRVVTGRPGKRAEEIRAALSYEDALTVEGEYFHLLVIEGPEWLRKKLPFDKTDLHIILTGDMTAYRTRKVRILNGAHTVMTPIAYLSGIESVLDAVSHPVVGRFITDTLYEEIIPSLPLSREELTSYTESVLNRFCNPFIDHRLISIALNSASKFETRVLPSLLYHTDRGVLPKRLIFALAAFIYFYRGKRGEENIPLNDEQEIMDFFGRIWTDHASDLPLLTEEVLGCERIWKRNLNEIPGLKESTVKALKDIVTSGIQEALTHCMESSFGKE